MRKLKCVLMFSLVLLLIAGCSKEEIKPDPLNATDDVSLKSAIAKKKDCKTDHFVPFKASFELTATVVESMVPSTQYDERHWPFIKDGNKVYPPCMYVDIAGNGNATHLGRTEFTIEQWWTKAPNPDDGISYGQGKITFIAANGDKLYATYFGTADHTDDDDGTEILTNGMFTGGSGRFKDVEGTFEWDGLFFRTLPGLPPFPDGEILGEGTVTVTGTIKYKKL